MTRDEGRTKKQLIGELAELRRRIAALEASEVKGKRAKEALRESEHRCKLLFENTCDGLIIIDAETLEITLANQAAANLYGFDSPDDAIGANPLDFIPPHERKRALRIISEDILEKDLRRVEEFRIITGDGAEIWVSAFGTRTVYDGKPRGLVSVRDITRRRRAEERAKQRLRKLMSNLEDTIYAMTLIMEKGDRYTAGHQRRVTRLACAIASEMGLPKKRVKGIRMAGLIHDLGKIHIPAEILSKPGPMTEAELTIIKAHPQVGYDILKAVEFPWPVAQIVLQHHERVDGSGYPQGLSGEDILLEARVLGVADVVEVMASHRPYQPAPGLDKALEEIKKNRGRLYDAEVVDVCLRIFAEKGFWFE